MTPNPNEPTNDNSVVMLIDHPSFLSAPVQAGSR